jgi:hypothetical protein
LPHVASQVAKAHGDPKKWLRDEIKRRHALRLMRVGQRDVNRFGSLVALTDEASQRLALADALLRPAHRIDPYVFWLEETATRMAAAAAMAELAVVTAEEEARRAAALAAAAAANLAQVGGYVLWVGGVVCMRCLSGGGGRVGVDT